MIGYRREPELPRRHALPRQKSVDPIKQLCAGGHHDAKGGQFNTRRQANFSGINCPATMGKLLPGMGTHLQRELRRRMTALKLSGRRISERAKLSEGVVKHILNGDVRSPRHDTVKRIATVLGCTVQDLMGDEEPAEIQRVAGPSSQVNEVDVTASAGGGALPDMENVRAEWQFPTEWVRSDVRSATSELRIITIGGDSMFPTLADGDKVIIDISRTMPSPPGIFAVWDGLALVAKRLEYIEGSDPPTVRIISDNERYRTYERTAEEIRIVGRLRGRWQRL